MRKRLRLAAVAVLVLLPAMARAQHQESAPPPATVRFTQGGYVLGSGAPRASGFGPGVSNTFAVEKRLRGHVYQPNVSNSLGTTISEIARGAANDRG